MCNPSLKVGEEEDGEAAVLTELLTAVMSGNTKALGTLVDRVKEGEVCIEQCRIRTISESIAAIIHIQGALLPT